MARADLPERPLPAWEYLRGLALTLVALVVLGSPLAYALYTGTRALSASDEANLREWLDESRVQRKTLPELAREYLELCEARAREAARPAGDGELPALAGDPAA